MLTTSDAPIDYLTVPSGRTLDQSKTQRSTSFNERSRQNSENIASNLSLPTAINNSAKKSRSSTRWQSTSSRVNACQRLLENNDEEKMEDFQTILVSDIVPSNRIQNDVSDTYIPKQRFSNNSFSHGLHSSPRKSHWTSLLLHDRSNDENSDVYKIFSILYGLVIFVGGVAFSISHAIIPTEETENIKRLAEIYFTYLYWVSIFWIIFCMFDIVHHRHKLPINASVINKLEMTHAPKSSVNLRLSRSKHPSSFSKEEPTKLSSTPHFNLQLFDDSDEFESDNEDDDHTNENHRHGTDSTKAHDDDDDNCNPNSRHIQNKSQSLDDISTKSSMIMRNRADTTRDFSTRRRALDPGAAHHLRTYVRHRKDSIVQRVIGYNYDDHSTAGGLYIRVGIGIFCLGTVIHSGLSILSNLETIPCARWTAVMDDISRLLFSFIQFFFIFKHSNLIIRAHESLARLAVMHIVVTNLCVWFRMVVIETKLQIIEISSHDAAMAPLPSVTSSITSTLHSADQLHHSTSAPYNCIQSVEDAIQMNAFINVGYMRLKPLLYPCTIEFSLMCLTLFFLIWENIGRTFAYKMSDKASSKNVFMVNCHASIKGLFTGMIVFSCTVISIILYAVFRNKIGDDPHVSSSSSSSSSLTMRADNSQHHQIHPYAAMITSTLASRYHIPTVTTLTPLKAVSETPKTILYSIAIIEIVNLFLLCISLVATTWALLKIRKLQYKRTTTRFDDVLIIVSLTGTYLYTIFSAFALLNNKNHSTWIAYLKIVIVVLEFLEATVHAFFILVALRKRLNRTNKHQYPAREVITLLIMIDLSLWFEETTTTTKHEANPFQLAFYHVIPWSIIAAIATPLQIFFRFHASVCLSHVWENMYILPAFEPVAPHGL